MSDETETPEDTIEVKWTKKGAEKTAPPPIVPDVGQLQRELDEERERVKTLQDRWQRAAADLANLRRRTEGERADLEKFATMLVTAELLPVLDNFERALATIPGNLGMLSWIQGVMLIERQLRAVLESHGLTPIDAEGQPFHPQLHEAVAERETADAAPGTILQEYQRGYTMHGRLIRPTLVEVARAPQEEPQPEETDQDEAEEIAREAETENAGP